jgi:carbohydrate diacid regulator
MTMTISRTQASRALDWRQLASIVACRTSEIVGGPVMVLDPDGAVLLFSTQEALDAATPADAASCDDAVRVPLRFRGQTVEVVVPAADHSGLPLPERVVHSIVDLVFKQAVIASTAPDSQTELKNRLIYSLLQEEPRNPKQALRDARLLGMDLAPPRAVILIDSGGQPRGDDLAAGVVDPMSTLRVVQAVIGFFELPDDMICAWDDQGEVAILKASDSKNLETWISHEEDPEPPGQSWANLAALHRAAQALLECLLEVGGGTINIGIGRYHPGIAGLAHSYADARAALSLGKRFHGDNRVHSLDGLGIVAFAGLTDKATKVSLAGHLLSPLDHEPSLVRTLEAFFDADCVPSATARALGIHRNTLSYRLDKIGTLTGLDPRRFDDAVQMRVALIIRGLDESDV